ncbi:MAG: DedA family protein, partial [Candidatus Cryptobacteroides sp.]
EKLLKQKDIVNRYGVWAALLSWLPLVGDVILLGLGFYKAPAFTTCLMILIGKAGRFVVWSYLLGFGLF